MKTNKMIIGLVIAGFAIAGLLKTETANAQSVPGVEIAKKQSVKNLKVNLLEVNKLHFKLTFENPAGLKTYIRILDTDANVLYSQNAGFEVNYAKYFNLTNLADGTYTFEVVSGKESFKKSLEIMTQTNRVVLAKN